MTKSSASSPKLPILPGNIRYEVSAAPNGAFVGSASWRTLDNQLVIMNFVGECIGLAVVNMTEPKTNVVRFLFRENMNIFSRMAAIIELIIGGRYDYGLILETLRDHVTTATVRSAENQ